MPSINFRLKHKKDTVANWESANPKILDGELIIVQTATGSRIKIGHGNANYKDLPFIDDNLLEQLSQLGKDLTDSINEVSASGSTTQANLTKHTSDTNNPHGVTKEQLGLDNVDIKYLKGIIDRFNGGPAGLEAISAAIGEEVMTLEDVCEPYLLQIGLINRTPRGRVVTELAYEHLKTQTVS